MSLKADFELLTPDLYCTGGKFVNRFIKEFTCF